MSLNTPFVYAQPESLSIPSVLMGDELKSFKGAKNNVKSIPSTSGSNVGPSSTILFSIPTGDHSFIKPNSMYVRMCVEVTVAANAAGNQWKFAGNSSGASEDTGGASSLINRVNVNLGGTVMSYNNYNHFRNSVLPHSLNAEYFYNDLKQIEYAGVSKVISANNADSAPRTIYASVPLWIPIFNSQQAFPSLLMSSPITIELLTETVNNAFAGTIAGALITNYSLRELNLVYETIDVSPEFKQALVSSKAGQMFNIHVNDFWGIGPTNADMMTRYQIGAGLSSLKAVLFTEQLADDVTSTEKEKKYCSNGLLNYSIYVNNQIVTPPNINDDSYTFLEMNRALQRINDSTTVSCLEPIANTNGTGLRSTYTDFNFLAGASTLTISDWGYSSCGIPASTVTLELTHGTPDALKWQRATAFANNTALYAFLLYDSVVSVDVSNGVVSIRK